MITREWKKWQGNETGTKNTDQRDIKVNGRGSSKKRSRGATEGKKRKIRWVEMDEKVHQATETERQTQSAAVKVERVREKLTKST